MQGSWSTPDQHGPKVRTPSLAARLVPTDGYVWAVAATLALWCVLTIATFATGVRLIGDIGDYDTVDFTDMDRLQGYATTYNQVRIPQSIAFVLAAVAFVVWLFRARARAERLGPTRHRRARGWLVFGWLVPIVSFWFPYQIMADLWHASDPRTRAYDDRRIASPGKALLGMWWGLLLGFAVPGSIYGLFLPISTSGFMMEIFLDVARYADVFGLGSAVLAYLIVQRISRDQLAVG